MNRTRQTDGRALGIAGFICLIVGVAAPFAARYWFTGALVPILIAYTAGFCLVALAVVLGILGWRDQWARALVIGVGLFLAAALGGYFIYTDLLDREIHPSEQRNGG